jgi:hypothetical protein
MARFTRATQAMSPFWVARVKRAMTIIVGFCSVWKRGNNHSSDVSFVRHALTGQQWHKAVHDGYR